MAGSSRHRYEFAAKPPNSSLASSLLPRLQFGQLGLKLWQVLIRRIYLRQFINRFFSALRVALAEQHRAQTIEHRNIVRLLDHGGAVPLFRGVEMAGVHVSDAQHAQHIKVAWLKLVGNQQVFNRLIESLDLILELGGRKLCVEI